MKKSNIYKDIMETFPLDIYLEEISRNLSYEDIVNLCQTNPRFRVICESNIIWERLLQRDFNVTYNGKNARNLYLKYRQTLDHFSKFYPIVTQHALKALVTFIPVEAWPMFDEQIQESQAIPGFSFHLILTIEELGALVLDNEEFEHLRNDIFEIVVGSIGGDENYDLMVQQLEQSNCTQLETIIIKPTLIFIRKRSVSINYDFDLAYLLANATYGLMTTCYLKLYQIRRNLLALR